MTLHSFAGIGGGDNTLARCIEMASKSGPAQNWRRCKTLIIDEVSMVDCQYFDVNSFNNNNVTANLIILKIDRKSRLSHDTFGKMTVHSVESN